MLPLALHLSCRQDQGNTCIAMHKVKAPARRRPVSWGGGRAWLRSSSASAGNVRAWSAELTPPATVSAAGSRCRPAKRAAAGAAACCAATNAATSAKVAALVCSNTACARMLVLNQASLMHRRWHSEQSGRELCQHELTSGAILIYSSLPKAQDEEQHTSKLALRPRQASR